MRVRILSCNRCFRITHLQHSRGAHRHRGAEIWSDGGDPLNFVASSCSPSSPALHCQPGLGKPNGEKDILKSPIPVFGHIE